MKKFLGAFALLAVSLGAFSAHAGSIDYLTNQSADFIRTFSRNAATDAADVVVYNPAGAAFLRDGLYFNLNTQTIFKKYEITYNGKTYAADDPTPILPTLFVAYKWKDLSAFGAFTVPAGGGNLTYEEGVPYLFPLAFKVKGPTSNTPTNGSFSGSSMYLGGTVGAAYRFFDMVSISAALRVISAEKTFKGQADYGETNASLDATKKAFGFGGIVGLHFRPVKMVDIGIRYELKTPLEFETTSTLKNITADADGPLWSFANGAKEKRDLPAVLAAGVAVHPLPGLSVSVGVHYYFIQQADAAKDEPASKKDPTQTGFVRSYDDDYSNGLELAVAVEYALSKRLLISAGYNRAFAYGNKDTLSDFEYALASHAVGGGARVTLLERLAVTVAVSAVFYEEASNDTLNSFYDKFMELQGKKAGGGETFNKSTILISLGLQYRLF